MTGRFAAIADVITKFFVTGRLSPDCTRTDGQPCDVTGRSAATRVDVSPPGTGIGGPSSLLSRRAAASIVV
jgi:hypothetical protein